MNNAPHVVAPSTGDIAELLAWARQLSQAGSAADPDERAAYLAAKAELLARITTAKEDTPS